jgi:hypothetical protein
VACWKCAHLVCHFLGRLDMPIHLPA